MRAPTPTCFSHSPSGSSASDSSRYFTIPHPPRAVLPPIPAALLTPSPCLPPSRHPEPFWSRSQEPQQGAVYLNYLALEYNVSFPQAARE